MAGAQRREEEELPAQGKNEHGESFPTDISTTRHTQNRKKVEAPLFQTTSKPITPHDILSAGAEYATRQSVPVFLRVRGKPAVGKGPEKQGPDADGGLQRRQMRWLLGLPHSLSLLAVSSWARALRSTRTVVMTMTMT